MIYTNLHRQDIGQFDKPGCKVKSFLNLLMKTIKQKLTSYFI